MHHSKSLMPDRQHNGILKTVLRTLLFYEWTPKRDQSKVAALARALKLWRASLTGLNEREINDCCWFAKNSGSQNESIKKQHEEIIKTTMAEKRKLFFFLGGGLRRRNLKNSSECFKNQILSSNADSCL